MLTKRSPIGIDVSGRFINAVQLAGSSHRWRIDAAVSIPRVDSDMPLDVQETGRLAATLARQGFRGAGVVLAVPPDRLLTGVVETPARSNADSWALVRQELASVHKCRSDSLEVAYWDLPRPARQEGANSLMAVACTQDVANALIDVFEEVGFSVRALDVESLAVVRAAASKLNAAGGLTAMLNLGWIAAQLVVIKAGVVVYERILTEHGMMRLHGRLISKLDLDGELVDHFLTEVGLRQDLSDEETSSEVLRSVRRYLTDHFADLASELRISLSYASQEHAADLLDQLLVHGEGATVAALDATLASQMSVDVSIVAPAGLLGASGLGESPLIVTALGLAQHPVHV